MLKGEPAFGRCVSVLRSFLLFHQLRLNSLSSSFASWQMKFQIRMCAYRKEREDAD